MENPEANAEIGIPVMENPEANAEIGSPAIENPETGDSAENINWLELTTSQTGLTLFVGLIGTLLGPIQIKYQNLDCYPFDTHKCIWIFILVIFIYFVTFATYGELRAI